MAATAKGSSSVVSIEAVLAPQGELELRLPRDRDGRFSTELFERYQRSEKALVSALAEIYASVADGPMLWRIRRYDAGSAIPQAEWKTVGGSK